MMSIFARLMAELPPFAEYITHVYDEKVMSLVGYPRLRDVQYRTLRKELFNPQDETNQDSNALTIEYGREAVGALLKDAL
jgi:hypothetical protein